MSNTIEDKNALFTKIIIERIELDFQKKQNILIENHGNRVKKIIEEYEVKKKNEMDNARKGIQNRKQHLILKARSNMRRTLLKKRKELMEIVLTEIKKKVKIFMQTKEYTHFLVEAINKVLLMCSEEQFIYLKFSENDIENREEIILDAINSLRNKDTYHVDAENSLIGGVFVKSGDGRLELDYTIDTILEESHKVIGEVLSPYLEGVKVN